MSIKYTITSYCSNCGVDFLETDSDDLDELIENVEYKADQMYLSHVKHGECV